MATDTEAVSFKKVWDIIEGGNLELLQKISDACLKNFAFERRNGRSLLHCACENDFTDIALHLLKIPEIHSDVPIESGPSDEQCGWTALFFACENENLVLVRELLEKGAEVLPWNSEVLHAVCGRDETPLRLAVRTGNIELVKELLKHCGKPYEEALNYKIGDLLYINTPIFDAVMNNDPKMVECLLQHKADVNHMDEELRLVLHYALENPRGRRQRAITRMVLNAMSDEKLNCPDDDGSTFLHLAVEAHDIEAIELLAKRGAKLLGDEEGIYPLRTAVEEPRRVLVAVLKAFELEITDSMFMDALEVSAWGPGVKCLEVMLQHSKRKKCLHTKSNCSCNSVVKMACDSSSAKPLRCLIKADFYINGKNLTDAFDSNIVKLLIEGGALLNVHPKGTQKAKTAQLKMAQTLLDHDNEDINKCMFSHGSLPTKTKDQQPVPFVPFVLTLQRLTANVIRAKISHAQNTNRTAQLPCLALCSAVKQLPIPGVLKNLLINLSITEDNDVDDNMADFDIFPVYGDGESDSGDETLSESEAEGEDDESE